MAWSADLVGLSQEIPGVMAIQGYFAALYPLSSPRMTSRAWSRMVCTSRLTISRYFSIPVIGT